MRNGIEYGNRRPDMDRFSIYFCHTDDCFPFRGVCHKLNTRTELAYRNLLNALKTDETLDYDDSLQLYLIWERMKND